jgi:hypothetical protein
VSQLQIAMERNEALEQQLLRSFDEKELSKWKGKQDGDERIGDGRRSGGGAEGIEPSDHGRDRD